MASLISIYSSPLNITMQNSTILSILESEGAKLRTFTDSQLKRTPALMLLLIPHAFKFYLLFVFYAKFRLGLSRFLKCRLYVNFDFLCSAMTWRHVCLYCCPCCCIRRARNTSATTATTTTNTSISFLKISVSNPSSSAAMPVSETNNSLSLESRFRPFSCCLFRQNRLSRYLLKSLY